MSAKGLEVIDHTVQLTHEWVNELTERLDWANHRDALRLLRLTLAGIRDHVGHEQAAQFAAQLPLLIRGMFYEGWKPSATPLKDRRRESFIEAIESHVGEVTDYRGPEDISTVLEFINGHVSEGEVADVRAGLPGPIRDLWPA